MKLTKERLKAIIQEELNENFGIARLVDKSRQRTASARRAKASSAAPTTKIQATPASRPEPSAQTRRPTGKPSVPQRGPYSKEEWTDIDAIHKAHREETERIYQKGLKDAETGIRDPEYPEWKNTEYDRGWNMALHNKKLTKEHLKSIIQEELQAILEKGFGEGTPPSDEIYKKREVVLEDEEELEEGWFGASEESGKLGVQIGSDLNALEARIEQLEALIKRLHGSELPAGKS